MSEPSKLTKIYIVRHGQTVANEEKIMDGHFNSPLAVLGEEQARLRAENLKQVHFDAVFSSDLVRAQQTAEIIKADRQLAVKSLYILREKFFGPWEGKKGELMVQENKHLIALRQTLSEEQKKQFKFDYSYESHENAAWRMVTFLREIAIAYAGKTVLVVAHGSIMKATLVDLGYAKFDELPDNCIDNTGYFVLESDGVDFFIKETVGVNKVKAV